MKQTLESAQTRGSLTACTHQGLSSRSTPPPPPHTHKESDWSEVLKTRVQDFIVFKGPQALIEEPDVIWTSTK